MLKDARERLCTGPCNSVKPVEEFNMDFRRKIPRSMCKECVKEYQKKYYAKMTEEKRQKFLEEKREWSARENRKKYFEKLKEVKA